jgi:hypothetical protein
MVKLLRACVWMPWRKKAKKDVASCEKPRGDASNQRSGDVRIWGNPRGAILSLHSEFIGMQSEPREVNHLSTWRKRKQQ